MPNAAQTGCAPVNGLNMYYEIHGTGQPLVVLHGAFMTIELMGKLVPELARSRQVIAVQSMLSRCTGCAVAGCSATSPVSRRPSSRR